MRRTASRAANPRRRARISPKATNVGIARAALTLALAAVVAAPWSSAATPSVADVDAAARAAGNRRPDAIALGRALLATTWPAQIMKIRIDGVGSDEVAGIVISGVKFHGSLDTIAFTREVSDIVATTFATSRVEEVDVWATVPLATAPHAVVAGDRAEPTSRTVYGATVLRGEGAAAADRLRAGRDVYWDPAWRVRLTGAPATRANR